METHVEVMTDGTIRWVFHVETKNFDKQSGETTTTISRKPHNENTPAIIYPNGQEVYYENGKLHRIGGPAIIKQNGSGGYYKKGIIIRLLLGFKLDE